LFRGCLGLFDRCVGLSRVIKVLYTLFRQVLKPSVPSTRLMNAKRCRRKPDLFSVLLLVVALGMSVTLAYQINVYYGGDQVPIATQSPSAGGFGG
jgi:hypothetical protein